MDRATPGRRTTKGHEMTQVTVSVRCASTAIGIGRTKLYELINEGVLDVVKLGRRTLITTESIERLIQSYRVAA